MTDVESFWDEGDVLTSVDGMADGAADAAAQVEFL
jgi:hypothetical protein